MGQIHKEYSQFASNDAHAGFSVTMADELLTIGVTGGEINYVQGSLVSVLQIKVYSPKM